HAFVHGDAMTVKELRSWLRFTKEVPRQDLSISGYWRRGNNDEQWRAAKKQWNAEVDAEELARAASRPATPAHPTRRSATSPHSTLHRKLARVPLWLRSARSATIGAPSQP